MGAKSEALAQQLETKIRDAVATLERLGALDWKRTTGAEQWSVGVTAHHIAGALEPVSHMVEAVVAGQSGSLTGPMLDEMTPRTPGTTRGARRRRPSSSSRGARPWPRG
jgi:hypothetical protein